ncbi:MAG: DNA translocase FtsK [Phycisphaeraceae bacterium]|nr:DNA translocase FtsK [Phycisphaeraceae bacterium]
MSGHTKKKNGKSPRAQKGGSAGSGGESQLGRRVAWLVGITAWAFIALAAVSFDPADPPSHAVWPQNDPVANLCGPVGAMASYHLFKLMGWGAWLLIGFSGLAMVMPMLGRAVTHMMVRGAGVVIIACSLSGIVALVAPRLGPIEGLAGGTIGAVVAEELFARFKQLGSMLWLLLFMVIGLIVVFDRWVLAIPALVFESLRPAAKRTAEVAGATAVGVGETTVRVGAKASGGILAAIVAMFRKQRGPRIREHDLDDEPVAQRGGARVNGRGKGTRAIIAGAAAPIDEDAGGLGGTQPIEIEPKKRKQRVERDDAEPSGPRPTLEAGKLVPVDEDREEEDDEDAPGAPQVYSEEELREKIAKLPVRFGRDTRKVATEDDLRDLQGVSEMEGYQFPGLDLLEAPEENFSQVLEEMVREQAQALEGALRQYKIDGEVVGIESGPVITLYDVRLAPGTKVAQLNAIDSDIARSLKAVNIRIVPNQAGRDTVGIEVPNPTKERVRLKELMSNSEAFAKMKLPMFLGKDAAGDPLIADLTQMPHMLIAGTTGSGKSVCMNTIIMSFLYTKKPNELKLVLVDPKMVEMSQFKDIPHLMCPVVTEMAKAAAILEWACKKMDERYELLAEAGCRDIASYNELPWEDLKAALNPATPEEEARIPRRLPYMVFIIDELADLMMTNKEVEGSIIRIAQKARAVGIHLILATQRPQANVVTGLIKSNMPCRISFKVASGMDSRIVLDQKGGELLLGQGDMLYLSPRTSKLVRSQGTLVDDKEIRRVVRFMRDIAGPTFERQLMQIRSGGSDEERLAESENNSSASLAAAQEDPMFDRAVEIVLESGRGSVSLLQRRLAIGYTRSSRLIDLMGIAGIISDHKGSVARDVLITIEQWEAMKRLAAEDEKREQSAGTLFAGENEGGDSGRNVAPATEEAPWEDDEESDTSFDDESDDNADEPDDVAGGPEMAEEIDEGGEEGDDEPPDPRVIRPDQRRNQGAA